jgi:hypothetical protein
MKPSDKILTYAQAKELKWFCDNVLGVRNDMYDILDSVQAKTKTFENRIKRLEKTCDLIEKFLEQTPHHAGR